MNEPKPFASLGPSLLARKGAARPAMRPQLQPMQQFHDQQFHEATARQLEEDLGWNDMGHDVPPAVHLAHPAEKPAHAPAPVASLAPPVAEVVAIKPDAAPAEAHVPEVVRQQEAVAERVAAAAPAPVPTPARLVPAAVPVRAVPARPAAARPTVPSRRSALEDGRRAAFTLRLDAERHLKLRLACTVSGRSAQQFVTDALDQLIASLPDIDSLAAQVRKRK